MVKSSNCFVIFDKLSKTDSFLLYKIFDISKAIATQMLDLNTGDKYVITGGYPYKDIKYTNFMKIDEV